MKRLLLSLVVLLFGVFNLAWAQLPEFSTLEAPLYYHIFFTNGGSFYVVDKGAGQQIITAASPGEGGKWAFVRDHGNRYLNLSDEVRFIPNHSPIPLFTSYYKDYYPTY